MQESVSMHKSPTQLMHSRMNQARSEEEEKHEVETVKTEARRLMERKAAQRNKNLSEEPKKAYLSTDQVNKAGGETAIIKR